jgi:hypothetical protein
MRARETGASGIGRVSASHEGKRRAVLVSIGSPAQRFLSCLRSLDSLVGFLVCFVATSVFLTGTPCSAQSSGVAEYGVKAIFLYDFAKFVDWPPSSRTNERAPLNLCIVGTDPFGGMLDNIVRGQRINEREIAIRRANRSDDLRSCQIVFVSRAENKYLPAIVDSLRGSSSLLVGESQDFAQRGGQIQLYLQDDSVHFAINVDAVQRAHLSISSGVLALARIVHDQNAPAAN